VQAQTIELLTGKGSFSTEQAVILAEAIDMGIEKAQLVTVPIMDARFAAVDMRFAETNSRMEAGFAAANARIDSTSALLEARMDLKMQRLSVKIIVATLAGQMALGPIGMNVVNSLRQAFSTLLH